MTKKKLTTYVLLFLAILTAGFLNLAARSDDVQEFPRVTLFNGGELRLMEERANGSSYIILKAPASLAANATLSLDQSQIQYADITVTAAQLSALRATPKVLIAAPGAGKALSFVHAQLIFDYTTPAFTETADNLVIRMVGTAGVIVSQVVEMTGFIDQTADMLTNAIPKVDTIRTKAEGENTAMVLHNNGDGEFAGSGGSTLRVNIAYRTVTTGL